MTSREKNGFFHDIFNSINKNLKKDVLDQFGDLHSDEERMRFIFNLPQSNDFQMVRDRNEKDLDTALNYKEKGNSMFKVQKWMEALLCYNRSYLCIPENQSEAAIILANRSAALYHMKEYNLALNDIAESISLGYPKEMLYKLEERRARCYLAMNLFSEALEHFKKTIHCLDESKIPFEKRAKMEKDAHIMVKLLPPKIEAEKKMKMKQQKNQKTEVLKEFLSDRVEFDYNEMEGRYAKSKKEIKCGESILVEKPHCFMLLEQYSKTHCQHCFRRTIAPYNCPTCSDVVFCSKACKSEALDSYHKYECGVLPILWKSGSSINCHMALRMISQKNLKYFYDIRGDLERGQPFEEYSKYPNNDYRKAYQLVCHESRRNAFSFFQYGFMSVFLVKCLKLSEFLSTDEEAIFISSLILRNLQLLQFNTHEVYELKEEIKQSDTKTVFIGGGLYPTLALFNHSCDPGIVRYYNGTTVNVHVIKTIKQGESINENYGPIYSQNQIADRKKTLNEIYWFDCQCVPCTENWPLYDEMNDQEIRFKCCSDKECKNILQVPVDCNDFMIKCNECGQFTNLLKGLKTVQDTEILEKQVKRAVEEGNLEKALSKNLEMINIMDDVLAPPFRDYCNCQQNIKDCFLRRGNKYAVPK